MRLGTNKAVEFSQLFALSSRNKAVKQTLELHYACSGDKCLRGADRMIHSVFGALGECWLWGEEAKTAVCAAHLI